MTLNTPKILSSKIFSDKLKTVNPRVGGYKIFLVTNGSPDPEL